MLFLLLSLSSVGVDNSDALVESVTLMRVEGVSKKVAPTLAAVLGVHARSSQRSAGSLPGLHSGRGSCTTAL